MKILQPEFFDVLVPYIREFNMECSENGSKLFISVEVPLGFNVEFELVKSFFAEPNITKSGFAVNISGYIIDKDVAEYLLIKFADNE